MTAKHMIVIARRATHHLLVGDIYEGSMTRKMRLLYLVGWSVTERSDQISTDTKSMLPLLPPCLDVWDVLFKNLITVIWLFKGVTTKLDKSKIQPKPSSIGI